MNDPTRKRKQNSQGDEPPVYSKEFPRGPQERDRATSGHDDDQKAREEAPDPVANAVPYGATNLHGTRDPSRFSTPPPRKP